MQITRRGFLHASCLGTVAVAKTQELRPSPVVPAVLDPNKLTPFVDPLPMLLTAKSSGMRPSAADASRVLPYYRVAMRQIETKVHRDLPSTRMWACGDSVPGPTFETRSGAGLLVEWVNELPHDHFLPIDHNLMGAEKNQPQVRTVIHLHGAKAPPVSDGYPEDWYVPGHSALYHYPNQQDAAMLWYHDHAMGINRLNIYAGLLGLFIIRDEIEDRLELPRGDYEIPLVIFDRFFTLDGQLYYPVSRNPNSPWIPELFGNAILVNGKLFPYLDVEPRPYRFRILNGSNGRFYRFTLSNGMPFHQIGCDQGFLAAPVAAQRITLGPGERCDLVIDFAGHGGEHLTLADATSDIMQFRVGKESAVPKAPLAASLRTIARIPESESVRTRELTLQEFDDVLEAPMTHLLNGARWHDPVTETPAIDTVEIWSLINLTDDSHPIHLHLVRFQILDRRPFDVTEYLVHRRVRYIGAAVAPDPTEAGWKDTVRASPGAVTRIIVRFEGYVGRYVWHCHILEHEDNEMMRPYEVIPS
jgi:spore coat protein A, manganese oxidase